MFRHLSIVACAAALGAGCGIQGTSYIGPSHSSAIPAAPIPVGSPTPQPTPAPRAAFVGAPVLYGWSPASPSADRWPTLLGRAAPNAQVDVHGELECAGAPLAVAYADDAGDFAVQLEVAPNSVTTVSAAAFDEAGSWACSAGLSYVHDERTPAVPQLVETIPASPSTEVCPLVRGSADASTEVALYADADCTGEPLTTVHSDAAGDFELAICVAASSWTAIRARSFAPSGAASACSDPLLYLRSDDDGTASDDPAWDAASEANAGSESYEATGTDAADPWSAAGDEGGGWADDSSGDGADGWADDSSDDGADDWADDSAAWDEAEEE